MKKLFAFAFGLVFLSIGLMAVTESPVVKQFGGVFNEPFITFSTSAVVENANPITWSQLPVCPQTQTTSEVRASALQWTSDNGWAVCKSTGWQPLSFSGRVSLDGGIKFITLPVQPDGGFVDTGYTCITSLSGAAAPLVNPSHIILGGGFLQFDGGTGMMNYQCE